MRRRRNTLTRRRFLGSGIAAWAGAVTSGTLFARAVEAAGGKAKGYGPVVADPNGLLELPEGFDYVVLASALPDTGRAGRLGNGDPAPLRCDGMAAFPGLAEVTVLVRNHALDPGAEPGVDPRRRRPYDPDVSGGTTTLWVDEERRVVRSFPSLSGTGGNGGGGATPWGTWLSCEAGVSMPGPADDANYDRTPAVSKPHGYVFEVDARAEGLVDPVPIRAMGRFRHGAAAADPATGFVYLTEDRDDGLLYRYRPNVLSEGERKPDEMRPGDLARGGALEALRIVDHPAALTRNWNDDSPLRPSRRYPVDWVRIAETDPESDVERDETDPETDPLKRRGRTARSAARAQGFRLGAAQFARGAGMVYQRGAVYFSAAGGGASRSGQLWKLDLLRNEIAMWSEPDDRALLDAPGNLGAAHWGDLLACESGKSYNRLVGVTGSRRYYPIARCPVEANGLAGACFSPDGRTLFVNTMEPGVTFAIRGPWRRR